MPKKGYIQKTTYINEKEYKKLERNHGKIRISDLINKTISIINENQEIYQKIIFTGRK